MVNGFDLIETAVLDFFPFNRYLLVQELDEKPEQLVENENMARFLEIDRNKKVDSPPQFGQNNSSVKNPAGDYDFNTIKNDLHNEIYARKDMGSTSPRELTPSISLQAGGGKELVDPYLFSPKFLLVERADSTQQKVIQASLEGKSFILEGPPGTGKTTTITNIVALNLLAGKKILFVAEKPTAMDQLAKGLEKCGLSPAVLKFPTAANGKWLVTELCRNLNLEVPEVKSGEIMATLIDWEEHRNELFSLTSVLSSYTKLEDRAYNILARADAGGQIIKFNCPDILQKDILWLNKARNLLQAFFAKKKNFSLPESALLRAINPPDPYREGELNEILSELIDCFKYLEKCAV
ncbi:MAG: AAA domain-containing protein, partial [Candidatus Riflebacteria bacterium]